tara:strand:+ start:142 stop:441 length:300 start_codon:yes stop_codon:yes gene_type:complete
MSNDNVKSMVNSLADNDNVAAQDAFKSALSDKIGQALDDKRMTVANDWLNAAHETEDLEQNAQLNDKPQGEESSEEDSPEQSIEIDDEESNEQPDISEV